jgi:hypothetical protein
MKVQYDFKWTVPLKRALIGAWISGFATAAAVGALIVLAYRLVS